MTYCDFAAGWTSGMIGLVVGHPFDTVKVVQQTQGIGTFPSAKKIHTLYGYKGFFRGLGFPLLASGASNSLFFGVYGLVLEEILKVQEFDWYQSEDRTKFHLTRDPENKQSNLAYLNFFAAGSIGGLVAVSITCPIELIKIKLQTEGNTILASSNDLSPKARSGPFRVLQNIIASGGVKGLYQGWRAMAYREMPSAGMYMTVYELCSQYVKVWSKGKHEVSNFVGLFVAGGVAGTCSWWSVIPCDVIKSKIQADDPKNPKYHGFKDCAKKTIQKYGIKGLFSGFWAISIRGFPVNGATFLSFELFNRICNASRKDADPNDTR